MAKEKSSKENPWKTYGNRRGYRSDIKDFVFEKGENIVRLCHARDDSPSGLPFFEFSQRWLEVRNNSKDLPIDHSADDTIEIDEVVDQLWEEHNIMKDSGKYNDDSPEIKEIRDRIYSINGRNRYDMNVIKMLSKKGEYIPERDEETDKIVIRRFTAGRNIFNDIKELAASEKWGDCSDPDDGYELIITKKIPKGKGEYASYTVMPNPDRRPLTDEELETINESAYKLEEIRESEWSTKKRRFEIMKNSAEPLVRELHDKLTAESGNDEEEEPRRKKYEDAEEESEPKQEEPKQEEPKAEEEEPKQEEPKAEKEETKEESKTEEEVTKEESKPKGKAGKAGKGKAGKAGKASKPQPVTVESLAPEDFKFDRDEYDDMSCTAEFEDDDTGCMACEFKTVCGPFTQELLKNDISSKDKKLKEMEAELNKALGAETETETKEETPDTEEKKGKKKIPF